MAPIPQRRDRLADPAPRPSRVAAEVDAIGPLGRESVGHDEQLGAVQEGGVIDLGQDLDVERAIAIEPRVGLAEEARQVAEVLGAELDRRARLLGDRRQVASAMAGHDHAVDLRGHLQVPRHPARRHQRGHRDRQHGHLGLEPRPRGQVVEHLPQRELGQPAGHEQETGPIPTTVTHASLL